MSKPTELPKFLSPDEVAALIPGVTKANLAQLRYLGTGPRFSKPSPKVVVYRLDHVLEWLEASERTITGEAA